MLKSTISCLNALKTAYINDPTKPRLYIHDHYDVIPHFDDSMAKNNFLWQIRSNLAQLMKIHYKLPEKIVIILNNTILDDTAFAVSQLANLLKWLLSEIEAAITFRRKHLPIRCLKDGEPAVFLMKMIPRGNRSDNSEMFKSVRRKLNTEIPTIMDKFEYGFINAYEITSTSSIFYDRHGKTLSPAGIIQFWVSISDTIKEMNENKRQKTYGDKQVEERRTPEVQKPTTTITSNQGASAYPPPRWENRSGIPYRGRRHTYDNNNFAYSRYHYHAQRKY